MSAGILSLVEVRRLSAAIKRFHRNVKMPPWGQPFKCFIVFVSPCISIIANFNFIFDIIHLLTWDEEHFNGKKYHVFQSILQCKGMF